ncbi:MAG: hypothetical protein RR659_05015 [Bacilli bacterium]
MDGFLIPANSKKSLLIFGAFTPNDFILLATGMGISLILLLVLPVENITFALGAITPGLICGFLVFPIPNYHNMITIFKNIYQFYTTNQKLVWKGWCLQDGDEKK